MSQLCTDEGRLTAWCASIAGEGLQDRRSELLWQYLNGQVEASAAAEIEQHLGSCEGCRAALEQERLLAALKTGTEKVTLAVCPSSKEMLEYVERSPALGAWRRLEIKLHAEKCAPCRDEAEWGSRSVAAEAGAPAKEAGTSPLRWFSWKWAGWAAAAAMLVLVFSVVYPSRFGSRRFARYAHIPDVPYEAMVAEFAAAHPDDVPQFRSATQQISLGNYQEGAELLKALESKRAGNPSILFFQGCIAGRQGRWQEATLLCTRAEKSPMGGYRCWYLANVALMAGDLPLARYETRHAKDHAPYKGNAERLEKLIGQLDWLTRNPPFRSSSTRTVFPLKIRVETVLRGIASRSAICW